MVPWFVRGYQMNHMRRAKITALKIDPELGIRGFCRMNPDQKGQQYVRGRPADLRCILIRLVVISAFALHFVSCHPEAI